jgi:ribosomal protein L3 glutamine methyltransferase
MQTIREALDHTFQALEAAELYYGHGTDSAWDEAVQMVLFVAELPHDSGEEVLAETLSEEQCHQLSSLLSERIKKRLPLPYLTHEAWFSGLKFFVDQRVIIPRSPFAEWIENQFSPWVSPEKVSHILDLCTGSGCMAIAAAYAFPEAQVDAVDISEEALAVAKINVEQHDLASRVKLLHSDGFNNIPEKRYDIIMSNPPYVSEEEMLGLPAEYHHEPELALKADSQGLALVHHILKNAERFLAPNGIVVVEVGNSDLALIEAYPHVPFVWLEQEHGGQGLFLLTQMDLAHVRK